MVRCRLGKLAFFNNASLARSLKYKTQLTAQTALNSRRRLLLKLSRNRSQLTAQTVYNTVCLVAHSGVNNLVVTNIIYYKLLSVKCSNCVK